MWHSVPNKIQYILVVLLPVLGDIYLMIDNLPESSSIHESLSVF